MPIAITLLPAVLRVQRPAPRHGVWVCAAPLNGFVTRGSAVGAPPARVTVAWATAGLPRFSGPQRDHALLSALLVVNQNSSAALSRRGFRTLRIIGNKAGFEKYRFFFRILSAWMPTPPH